MKLRPQTIWSARTPQGKVRFYGQPMFVRPDGQNWRRLEELVTVRHDARSNVFRIECGQEWIELAPRVAMEGVEGVVLRSRCFGWLLSPQNAPLDVECEVRHSQGVKARPTGWELGRFDGVPLGLFLDDWKRRFGLHCAIDIDRRHVHLDLRAKRQELLRFHQAAAEQGGPVPKRARWINLDPTILPDEVIRCYSYEYIFQDPNAWQTVRDATEADSVSSNLLEADGVDGCYGSSWIHRSGLRFDTSAYPAGSVTAAVLHLYYNEDESSDDMPDKCSVNRCYFVAGALGASVYGAVRNSDGGGYENKLIGYFPDDGQEWTPRWQAMSILPHYEQTETFDLGLAHQADVIDEGQDIDCDITFAAGGDNGPYLELTTTGGAGTSMTLTLAGVGS